MAAYLVVGSALAQAPTITGLAPTRNERAAPVGSGVAVTFSQPMSGASASAASVKVFSHQRGGRMSGAQGGAASVSGNTISFNPATDFRPGETVFVSTTAAQGSGGANLAAGHVHQFTTATGGTGVGNFQRPSGTSVFVTNPAGTPQCIAVGDVDSDGDLDFVAADGGAFTATVQLNDGAGGFTPHPTTPNPGTFVNPRFLALGDIDGDGDLDFVTVSPTASGVNVRLNDGAGSYSASGAAPDLTSFDLPTVVRLADVDGDGDLDLLANSRFALNVRYNNGSGNFSTGADFGLGSTATGGLTVGDVDNDGDVDAVMTASGAVQVLHNSGAGAFGVVQSVGQPEATIDALLADFDGDGDLDLATGTQLSAYVTICPNAGNGTFTVAAVLTLPGTPMYHLEAGDVDADGDLDVVSTNQGTGGLTTILFNDGFGGFDGPTATTGGRRTGVALADVDGDGDLDLLTSAGTGPGTGAVYVQRNDGTGTFAAGSQAVPVGDTPEAVTTADINGDGAPDLVAANTLGNSLSVRLNNGTGTFAATDDEIAVGSQPRKSVPVDLDGDGDLDLLAAGLFNNRVITRFNASPDLVVNTVRPIFGGSYNSITVTGTGVGTLVGPVAAAGAITVQSGGTLVTACQPLTGAGSFAVQAGATLRICDAAGISLTGATGAVQVTGARTFSGDATYAYYGTTPQTTGTGLPATARELLIQNAAGVSLSQPVAIRRVLRLVAGTLATNNQLTLLSDATRTAYAVHAGGATSGTATVQRYVGGVAGVAYRHLSAPVQNSPVADLATAGFAPRVNAAYNAIPTPRLPAAGFPTVFGFDETRGAATATDFTLGYYPPTELAAPLTPGRGWSVAMRGNQTPDFVGALTTGDVLLTGLTRTGSGAKAGWHLLGNPYPQPICWDSVAVPTGMSASIFVHRTLGPGQTGYLVRGNGIGSLPGGVLTVGQGFFTQVTGAGPAGFVFTDALRVEAEPAPVARPAADLRPKVGLTLTKVGAPAAEHDETWVYAEAGATLGPGADARYDALRPARNEGLPTLASLIGGAEAAINGLPETVLTTGATTTIELLAVLPTPGAYALRVAEAANLGATPVALLDRLTGTTYDLGTDPVLPLVATAANEEVRGRFALVFGQSPLGNSSLFIPHSAFTLWPNPSSGRVHARLRAGTARLDVLDAAGRIVRTVPTPAPELTLDLPPGFYTGARRHSDAAADSGVGENWTANLRFAHG